MKLLLPLLLLAIAAPARAKDAPAPVHIISLDSDFPVEALAGPGIEIETNVRPVGKNGPLPSRTLRRIESELKLSFPAEWDALEQDLFFGRAEFEDEKKVSKRYGSLFTPRQLSELRQSLIRARAEAIRRGEKQ